MGVDCVVALRPKSSKRLNRRDSRYLLDALEDGTLLLLTAVRLVDIQDDPTILRTWLEDRFGSDLLAFHDDERGVLFFGDVVETEARTYADLVEEVEYAGGSWLSLDLSRKAVEKASRANALAKSKSFAKEKRRRNGIGLELTAQEFSEIESDEEKRPRGRLVEGDGSDSVCFLVQRKSQVRPSTVNMRAIAELPDGSTIVMTKHLSTPRARLTSRHDEIAWRLADEYEESISQHADRRGVPIFRAEHLSALQNATSYEHALETLEGVVAFVVPKGTAAREAERGLARQRLDIGAKRNAPTRSRKVVKKPSHKTAKTLSDASKHRRRH